MISIFSCNRTNSRIDIQTFFNDLVNFECADSAQNSVRLKSKYVTINQTKTKFITVVPDSVLNSDFYNSYADRLIDLFYDRINSDTAISLKNLLTTELCNSEMAKEKVIKYCTTDKGFYGAFNEAVDAFIMTKN